MEGSGPPQSGAVKWRNSRQSSRSRPNLRWPTAVPRLTRYAEYGAEPLSDSSSDVRGPVVDWVYIAASAHDARYTRTCVASIRYFYPEAPIRLLIGGALERRLAEELQRYWGVEIAAIARGDYGWGFVKLEALFGPPGERF